MNIHQRAILDNVRKKINKFLSDMDEASFETIGTINHSDSAFVFTIRGNFLFGEGMDKGKVEFDLHAERYGLSPDDHEGRVNIKNKTYILSGIRTRNRKYPIIAKGSDGLFIKLTPMEAKNGRY